MNEDPAGSFAAVLTAAPVGGWGLVLLAVTAAVAGAINSVAGGGTILTFPLLTALLPPGPGQLVVANATSTIGLWPGALAAAWAYRGERQNLPGWARWLVVPSVIGAIVGTLLVLVLPPGWFAAAVPWLILTAAVLFAAQPRLTALATRAAAGDGGTRAAGGSASIATACLLQLAVAVYGGYFGAGIGILMLAVLGLLGLGDIHRLNGVKNVLGMAINGVSAAVFAGSSLVGAFLPSALLGGAQVVAWPCAAVMAVGAVAGGLAGSHVARRLPAHVVRRGVALIGFALAAYYLWREYLA
jgi:uncharacterized membrane protein YfcA